MTRPKRAARTPEPHNPRKEQTFLEHLQELRWRLFVVALAFIVGGSIGFMLQDQLVALLLAPLKGERLIYLTPGGGLDFILKISMFAGALVALPVVVYHVYKYVAPAVATPRTRRFTVLIVSLSSSLAAGGVLFGYLIGLPAALNFLTGFADKYLQASLTAESYMDFVTLYSLGMAALFQLPILLLGINQVNGPLKPSTLLKSEPYVLLGAFVIAALLTPTPDAVNQTIIAVPVVAVYQLGVVMVLVRNRLHKRVDFLPVAAELRPVTDTQSISLPAAPSPVIPQPARRGRQLRPAAMDIAQRQKQSVALGHRRQSVSTARLQPKPRVVSDIVTLYPRPAQPGVQSSRIPAGTTRRPLMVDGIFVPARHSLPHIA